MSRFEHFADETVLVHGAAGFVAAALLPSLVDAGWRRLLLVDRRAVHPDRIVQIEQRGAAVEVFTAETLTEVPASRRVDVVISLAGVTDVDVALREPRLAFDSNLRIALDVAEWLRLRREPTRLVYLSSDEVLGETWVPLPEDAPLKPTQPYAASKAAAELLLHNYRDVYGLDIITLRSCNLVGGGQRARKLIPVAVSSLLACRPVPVYGSGLQKREWMAVEDLCAAILVLTDRSASPGVYQAASGVHLSVIEVVEAVAEAIGRRPLRTNAPDRAVHDACYAMRTERLRATGWKPDTDPLTAIREAARHMALAAGDQTWSSVGL